MFPAHSFVFHFQLLLLQFQSLLRLRSYSGILNLFPHLTLHPFRIVTAFFYISRYSRTKPQAVIIFQNEIIDLIVLGFCAKNGRPKEGGLLTPKQCGRTTYRLYSNILRLCFYFCSYVLPYKCLVFYKPKDFDVRTPAIL